MFLDDFFANGQAEASTVGLAKRDKRLEKFAGNFGGDAGTRIFHDHPDEGYIQSVSIPKVEHVRAKYPDLIKISNLYFDAIEKSGTKTP